MKRVASFLKIIAFVALTAMLLSACGGGDGSTGSPAAGIGDLVEKVTGGGAPDEDPSAPDRDSSPQVLVDAADGTAVFDGNDATVDYSHANDGYIMVRYQGDNPKTKVQITKEGGDAYTYDLEGSEFEAFPLSRGSGNYDIAVFLNVSGDQYSQAAAQTIQAEIADEFQPFLRPNQYCNFTSSSKAVAKAQELAAGSKSDIGVVYKIFNYITGNVVYDYDKAASVQSGYLPNVDDTLATGKGICFDYASLMTAMLRSQRIPCELVVGYAGEAYHAWIAVHLEDTGKVMNIEFNGDKWTLMDPTFTASGDTADPNVVGDGENYNPVYYY
jgi:transglutaminase-like putative cysteine protease